MSGFGQSVDISASPVAAAIETMPREWQDYLAGKGPKPGTYLRDLAASGDQIPRWGYVLGAAFFLGLGYWAFRKEQKGKSKRAEA